MMPPVNVRTAAQLTGRDRSTITRAIESSRLSAAKDDRGRYEIDPAELERVFGPLRHPHARTDAVHEDPARMHDAAERDALARELQLTREMLERERSERERERRTWDDERTFLRALVERHSRALALLTDERPKRRWWQRWRKPE